MIYRIDIEDLTFDAIIGILETERKEAQKVIVNLSFTYAFTKDFIDYAKVAALIQRKIQEGRYHLLEEALEDVAKELKKLFPQMRTLSLTISKPSILDNATPSVTLELNFS